MKKMIYSIILILSLLPININIKAEDNEYQIIYNDIDLKLTLKIGDIIPNPEYTKELPEGMEFCGWYNSDGFLVGSEIIALEETKTIIFNPIIQQKENIDNENPEIPDINLPEKPNDLVEEYETTVTNNDIILHVDDVDNVDYFQMADVNINQIKKTIVNDKVIKEEQVIPTIEIKQNIEKEIKKQQMIFNLTNSNKDFVININVVSNDYILNEDKTYAIKLKNEIVKISQTESKKIKTKEDLINLHQISAINCYNDKEEIAILQSGNINEINQGKIGEYIVNYGVLSKTKSPFLVTAKVIVEADEGEVFVEENDMEFFEDTVNEEQLIKNNDNQKIIQEEKINNTGINKNIVKDTIFMGIIILYFIFKIILKNHKKN